MFSVRKRNAPVSIISCCVTFSGSQRSQRNFRNRGVGCPREEARKIPLPIRTLSVARGARSKPSDAKHPSHPGSEAFCPNVTGRARGLQLNSKSKRPELPLTLKVRMYIIVEDHIFSVRAFVDTGAEVNIIRRGVIPENFLQKDSHPLTLWG